MKLHSKTWVTHTTYHIASLTLILCDENAVNCMTYYCTDLTRYTHTNNQW